MSTTSKCLFPEFQDCKAAECPEHGFVVPQSPDEQIARLRAELEGNYLYQRCASLADEKIAVKAELKKLREYATIAARRLAEICVGSGVRPGDLNFANMLLALAEDGVDHFGGPGDLWQAVKPVAYFVAYTSEISLQGGGLAHWPGCRIVVGQHPLQWFASIVKGGSGSIAISWWCELTAEELALNTQVITE